MDIDYWNDDQKKKYALELHDQLEKAIEGFYLEINDIEIVKRALSHYVINLVSRFQYTYLCVGCQGFCYLNGFIF